MKSSHVRRCNRRLLLLSTVCVTIIVCVSVWTDNKVVISILTKGEVVESKDKVVQSKDELIHSKDEIIQSKDEAEGFKDEDIVRADVSPVGKVFPIDSRPPITVSRGFVIENQGLCAQYLSLTYVVVVHTALSHFDRRESLRNTWARSGIFNGVKCQTIFLIGRTLNESLQNQIVSENDKNGDIVQGDFIDDYKNLTLKAVMGLKWITKNCPNAQFVIKVDDDVFVNIFQAIKTVFPLLEANPKQVYCHVEPKAYIFREDGKIDDAVKWKMSNEFFKNQRMYPMPFCYGYATFYTSALAADLFETAASTPFFRLDDVYIYGILVTKTKGTSWRNGKRRFFKNGETPLKLFLKDDKSLVGTIRSVNRMSQLWNSILPKNTS